MSALAAAPSRLPPEAEPAALRACLLSGGESRRMGTDKALLAHPAGGTWLERALCLLGELKRPLTLVSHHPAHGGLARRLGARKDLAIEVLIEPPPREGPLLALTRLMAHHPGERLLLAPVDMPWLQPESLRTLLDAANADADPDPGPDNIHLAHDGRRLQPLLGLYPATLSNWEAAAVFTARGGRSLLGWLEQTRRIRPVALDPFQLLNANTPADWTSSSGCPPGPGGGDDGSSRPAPG